MMSGDTRFVFIAPMFNASSTVGQMIASIVCQSYTNWRIILIDDVSDTHHALKSKETIDAWTRLVDPGASHGYSEKITVVWNDTKMWEVANVLRGLSMCEPDDVICRIDADDWLTEVDALSMIAQAYDHTGCDVLWTKHRWGFSDKNISEQIPDHVDPYNFPWVSSHLKTFRKRLLDGVNDENFRGDDGEYIKRAGDQAIYLPCLKLARRRAFMPRCVYHYTINDVPETYTTPDARFQRDEALFLRRRGFVGNVNPHSIP